MRSLCLLPSLGVMLSSGLPCTPVLSGAARLAAVTIGNWPANGRRRNIINNKRIMDEHHRGWRTAADPDVLTGGFHLLVDLDAGRTESNVAAGVTAARASVMEVKMTHPDSTDGPEFRDEFGGREPASDTDAFGGPQPG